MKTLKTSSQIRNYKPSHWMKRTILNGNKFSNKYVNSTLVFNTLIPYSFVCFIVFVTCKRPFDIANINTTVIVQAIVSVGFHFTWSCICLVYVKDVVSTFENFDTRGKAINFINVREHNDVLMSIKVHKFRSRNAKCE